MSILAPKKKDILKKRINHIGKKELVYHKFPKP